MITLGSKFPFISRYFELTGDECKLDKSEGMGEIDHFTIENAVEYLRLMPAETLKEYLRVLKKVLKF